MILSRVLLIIVFLNREEERTLYFSISIAGADRSDDAPGRIS